MAWKKRIVKNEWETWAENDNFDRTDMSKNKIVKIQLVFKVPLAGPKTHVRRIIGIITPDARCKSKKFRSRMVLWKSCSRWGKKRLFSAQAFRKGRVAKTRVGERQQQASQSTVVKDRKTRINSLLGENISFLVASVWECVFRTARRHRQRTQTRYYLL